MGPNTYDRIEAQESSAHKETSKMPIPNKTHCFQLMYEMQMPEHIVAHSLQVYRVASFLTTQLKDRGVQLNLDLIQAAALLHDITKARSFKTSENHALTGGEHITNCGYPQVGQIIKQHVRLEAYDPENELQEAEIVNYSDKRVVHQNIVLLENRLDYIMAKYGTTPKIVERITYTWKKTRELEAKIFSRLPISPEDVAGFIVPPDCSSELSEYHRMCG
jgi:putative nucleotidyltransferase with HDIG domain